MHLSRHAAGSATATAIEHAGHRLVHDHREGGGGGYAENWSSLIGIITAIIGNVLISFALNMQRYAHICLERDWQATHRRRKKMQASNTRMAAPLAKSGRGSGNSSGSGSSTHSNSSCTGNNKSQQPEHAAESDPLLAPPSAGSQSSRDGTVTTTTTATEGSEDAYQHQSYLKSPYWWLGIVLMIVGEAGNFLAYGFAPASIVSPLGVVALISNCIIAPFLLKEPFRARDALGVVIAVGGAVTVVLSANDNNPKLGPNEIWHLITRWEFETYLAVTVVVGAGLMVASNRFGQRSVLVDLGLVGLLGGYTALSTKGVSSLLSYTLWRAITFPVFYLLIAILVATAIMQIKYVNRALRRFDATQVIPVQFVLFTLSVIGGSAVLYRDFERTSREDAGKFFGGCALTFFGVWLITSGRPPHNDEDDREPELEDAIHLTDERYLDEVPSMRKSSAENTRRSSTITQPYPTHPITPDASRPTTPRIKTLPQHPITPTQTAHRSPVIQESLSSLLANPWTALNDASPHTPTFNRHTSTPVLPSEAAAPLPPMSPTSPMSPTKKNPEQHPSTPTSPIRRHRLPHNRNAARHALAPNSGGSLLASPLSTALSAIVQDMQRGSTSAARRRGSLWEVESGGLDVRVEAGPEAEGEQAEHVSGEGERSLGRARSLSGTLSELWRRGGA